MSGPDHQWATRVLSGEERGVAATSLRLFAAGAEPFYSAAMIARNFAYDRRLRSVHQLPGPTISVGNLTTGGTGKTPIVRWLCEQLDARGRRPAVLLRGYGADAGGKGDEANVLSEALGGRATVIANRDRVAGARSAMSSSPPPDVFVLDDGFQHRKVARVFDLVLIDATNPFGFGHVLPRGLMREPMRGLSRANSIVVTRSDQVSSNALRELRETLQRRCPKTPIYSARHTNSKLLSPKGGQEESPVALLAERPFFAFAGIGNPRSLRDKLSDFAGTCVGFSSFPDHHLYAAEEIAGLQRDAKAAGAQMLLTTEKDWVKLRSFAPHAEDLPIYRLDLQIEFETGDEGRLLRQIMERIEARQSPSAATDSPAPERLRA